MIRFEKMLNLLLIVTIPKNRNIMTSANADIVLTPYLTVVKLFLEQF